MSYSIVFDQKPRYLHAKVRGDNTPESVRGYVEDVRRECSRGAIDGVLIEENLRGPDISLADVFVVVSEGSTGSPPGIRKIAYVDLNREHDHSLMRFAETVAVNRGVNMRLFRSVEEAKEWLLEEDAGPRAVDDV